MEVKDSNGNLLNDGDSVTLINDQKVMGAFSTLKKCRADNVQMVLETCFQKKA